MPVAVRKIRRDRRGDRLSLQHLFRTVREPPTKSPVWKEFCIKIALSHRYAAWYWRMFEMPKATPMIMIAVDTS